MGKILRHLPELGPEAAEPDDPGVLGRRRGDQAHHLAARIRQQGVAIFHLAEDLQELSRLLVREAIAVDDDGGAKREGGGKLGELEGHANPELALCDQGPELGPESAGHGESRADPGELVPQKPRDRFL